MSDDSTEGSPKQTRTARRARRQRRRERALSQRREERAEQRGRRRTAAFAQAAGPDDVSPEPTPDKTGDETSQHPAAAPTTAETAPSPPQAPADAAPPSPPPSPAARPEAETQAPPATTEAQKPDSRTPPNPETPDRPESPRPTPAKEASPSQSKQVSPLQKRYRGRPPLRWKDPRKQAEEAAREAAELEANRDKPPWEDVPAWRLVGIGLLLLVLPFLTKPIHVDDANFLTLARGVLLDFWRPHAIQINWQGTTEPAFDVLSNPPGVAYWLAPVLEAPVWFMHLWMLLWLPLAFWGAWKLGHQLCDKPILASLLICGSPIALLASHSLLPDLPLLACTLAGAAGLVTRAPQRAWPFALLLGSAALFRYSGIALIPLAALWGYLAGERRHALLLGAVASVPIFFLTLHDYAAYGGSHFLSMLDFQQADPSLRNTVRKLLAAVGTFGGAVLLPILCWRRPGGALLGAFAGVGAGLIAAGLSQHQGWPMITTVAALGAGGASLGGALAQLRHHRDREVLWLITWGLGGLVFLLGLRFTAARYWIPFCAPWILLALRDAGPRLSRVAAIMTVTLSLVLAISDLRFARAQSQLAKRLLAMTEGERGFFAGHWGWQHHFEANGWKPLEEDTAVPFGALLATSEVAWPQEPQDGCFTQVATLSAPASWLPIPRVHTSQGAANFHAFVISQAPPVETYAPWGFGFDPLERVHLQRSCGPKSNLD